MATERDNLDNPIFLIAARIEAEYGKEHAIISKEAMRELAERLRDGLLAEAEKVGWEGQAASQIRGGYQRAANRLTEWCGLSEGAAGGRR